MPLDFVTEVVEMYADQEALSGVWVERAYVSHDEYYGSLHVPHPRYGRAMVLSQEDSKYWDQAIQHEKLADTYQQAILRPWLLVLN